MKLNLGCGQHFAPRPEWVNVDSHRFCKHSKCVASNPDVIADVRHLPFVDGCAEAIYGAHILEHLPFDEVIPTLREWRRVLHPDGRLGIVGPDYDRAIMGWPDIAPLIWPGQPGRWDGAAHQWCATATNSLELVRGVFPGAREIPIAEFDSLWPCVSFLGWQFAIEA